MPVKTKTYFLYSLLLFGVLMLEACHPEQSEQLRKAFDLAKWQADRGGCKGIRTTMINQVKAAELLIKGLTQNEIADLMGKPDRQQLAERNQKFYVYFLENGEHCQNAKQVTNARSVAFRFSAIGLVTEVTFQNGMPR